MGEMISDTSTKIVMLAASEEMISDTSTKIIMLAASEDKHNSDMARSITGTTNKKITTFPNSKHNRTYLDHC